MKFKTAIIATGLSLFAIATAACGTTSAAQQTPVTVTATQTVTSTVTETVTPSSSTPATSAATTPVAAPAGPHLTGATDVQFPAGDPGVISVSGDSRGR